MTKKELVLLAILVLTVIMTNSCGEHRYPAELITADSLCEDNPDSALSLLSEIGKDSTQMQEADLMYWRLLRIKAADKAYIPFTSDSAAIAVMHYYEDGGDRALLPTAYYYAGRASADIGDAPQALDYYQKALDVIKYNRYKRLEGLIHSQMGYIFNMQNLHDQAKQSWLKALEIAKKENDTKTVEFSLRDIGDSYMNSNQYDSAYSYYNQALRFAIKQSDKFFEYDLYPQIAYVDMKIGKYESALSNIRKSFLFKNPIQESAKNCTAALIFEKMGNTDSAFYYYNRLNYCGNLYGKEDAYKWMSKYYSEKNISDSARKYTALYGIMLDSISHIYAIETTARMNALYNYQIKEKENVKLLEENLNKRNLIIIFISIIILITLASVYIVSYSIQRNKLYKHKTEKYNLLLEEFYNQKPLNQKKQESINNTEIVKKIRRILNKDKREEKLKDDDWAMLHDAITERYPNFDSALHDLYANIKTQDIRVSMLIKIGIKPVDIAYLTSHTEEAISSTRRRLYERAFNKKGRPSDWDKTILSIG